MTTLDFTHHHTRSIYIAGCHTIVCGSHVVAVTPNPHDAERITALLNEHGLANTDDLENGVEA